MPRAHRAKGTECAKKPANNNFKQEFTSLITDQNYMLYSIILALLSLSVRSVKSDVFLDNKCNQANYKPDTI